MNPFHAAPGERMNGRLFFAARFFIALVAAGTARGENISAAGGGASMHGAWKFL
ncbi:hypothetical protein [Caballeronia sp.]|uniref:hypothetical protein n=1 Tax=Caballeronia sp. TaxID=1931223 RepID=UPI003C383A11